jgi:hypothetical protein
MLVVVLGWPCMVPAATWQHVLGETLWLAFLGLMAAKAKKRV